MPDAANVDPAEAATTVHRTLQLPEIAAVQARLVPECVVASSRQDGLQEAVTMGVADAVALDEDGAISLVVDWKSDVDPTAATLAHYRAQIAAYLDATGCQKGLLVLISAGVLHEVLQHRL